jgi:thiamine transport system permease protein
MEVVQPRYKNRARLWNILAAVLWGLPLIFLGIFFFYPLASIFAVGFSATQLEVFRFVDFETIWHPLRFTLWQALLSTILTLLVGMPGAYLFSHYEFPGKKLLYTLTTIPFILPTVVVAASFNALLGPRGWINTGLMSYFNLSSPPLQIVNTLGAILLAHVFYNTTIVIRIVGNFWVEMDPNLQQAARVLGADRWRTFREVTLPLLRPAILASALLVFLFDFTSFGVVLLLGGPRYATLEVEIYIQAMHLLNIPAAAILSIIQLLCTLLLTVIYTRLATRVVVPLKLRRQPDKTHRVRTLAEKLSLALLVVFILLLLVAPVLALTARSVTRLDAARDERGQVAAGLTMDYYRELFINRRGSLFYTPPILAARNSLAIASATVLISVTFGFMAAYALRHSTRLARLLDPLLMLPLGASAVTLGLGFIVALNRPPLDLRTSPLLVPLVHSLIALPFVIRSLYPTMSSIPERLHEAATVLGASPFRVWREIDLPIMARAGVVSGIFAFTVSMGEFGATALVARPEFPTLPVAIYRFLSQPGALNYGQAMAMANILMVICGVSILLVEYLRPQGASEF